MPKQSRRNPYYVQVESFLREKILKGQLARGEQLPSLRELSKEFGVSQITIRTALSNLKAERLVSGQQGKGIFVAEEVQLRKHVVFTGDLQTFFKEWETYRTKALGIETKKVRETRVARELEDFFGISAQDPVCVVRRVRFIDRNPVTFFENILRPEMAGHLTLNELSERPIQRILESKTGLAVGENETYLECVAATRDVAEVLNIDVFTPLFLVQSRFWDASGEPFEIVNIFMRSDFFKYKIEVQRAAKSKGG